MILVKKCTLRANSKWPTANSKASVIKIQLEKKIIITIIILYGQIAPANNVYFVSKKNTTIWLNQIKIPNSPVVLSLFLVTFVTFQSHM